MTDIVALNALHRAGVSTADGSQVMLAARAIKTDEEVALLDHAAAIVDAVYERIYELLRPGVTERHIVAEAQRLLFELGSEQVEAINAVSGDRCNPHPHVFSDRLLRPGDQAFFDIIHSFMGYRTCYYRTFSVGGTNQAQLDAYKQCREWLDDAIDLVKPGVTTDEIAAVWPTAQELGFADEASCFGLQFGHGLGVGLYESPMISRLHSFENPVAIEEGMVFALETYCAARDGISAARIEEEVLVTADGNRLLTRFPADELLVAGRIYVRGADLVSGYGAHAGAGRGQVGASPARTAPAAQPKRESPERPTTNQIASTGSSPTVASRCGVVESNEIESPGPEQVILEPDRDLERARQHVPVLAAGVAHEVGALARGAAGLVDHEEEVDVGVRGLGESAPSARRSPAGSPCARRA